MSFKLATCTQCAEEVRVIEEQGEWIAEIHTRTNSPEHLYNGWTNYETWSVSLYIDNEQWSHYTLRELVKQIISEASTISKEDRYGFTIKESSQINAARILKEWIRELIGDAYENDPAEGKLAGDIACSFINAAYDRVNWREITDPLVDEIMEEMVRS